MARRALPVVGVLVALAVAGCGGDEASDTLTRAQFIARADALCPPAPAQRKGERRSAFDERFADLRERQLERIRALGAPKDVSTHLGAYAAASRAQITAFRRHARFLRRNEVIQAQNIEVAADQASAGRTRSAALIGFRRCGQLRPPITSAGFVSDEVKARADAACKRATDVILDNPPTDTRLPQLARNLELALPSHDRLIRELRPLVAQARNRSLRRLFDVLTQRVAIAHRHAAVVRAGGGPEFGRLLERDRRLYVRGAPYARAAGLTVCGNSGQLGL